MASLPILIVGTVFLFVYLMVRVSARERDEKRRIDLVERALDSGHIDERTKRELLEAVVHRGQGVGSIWLALGWLGLCLGVGLIGVAMASYNQNHMFESGILIAAVSFGAISLPVALRELNRMAQPQRHHSISRGES